VKRLLIALAILAAIYFAIAVYDLNDQGQPQDTCQCGDCDCVALPDSAAKDGAK